MGTFMPSFMDNVSTTVEAKIGSYVADRIIEYLKTPSGKFRFEFTVRISFHEAIPQDIVEEAFRDTMQKLGGKKDKKWTLVRSKVEIVIEEIIFTKVDSLELTMGEFLELEGKSPSPTEIEFQSNYDDNIFNIPIELIDGISLVGNLRRAKFGGVSEAYLVLEAIPKKLQQKFPIKNYDIFLRIYGENEKETENIYKELLEEFYHEIDWKVLNEKQKKIYKYTINKESKRNIIKINLSTSQEIGIDISSIVDKVVFTNKFQKIGKIVKRVRG